MNELIQWLITSSADPKKVSLAVRGALLAIAPIVMYATGLTEADFNNLVEAIVTGAFALTTLVSVMQIAWGLLRKVNLGRWSALQ